MTSLAPSRAYARAIPLPMPVPAPVITAILPSSCPKASPPPCVITRCSCIGSRLSSVPISGYGVYADPSPTWCIQHVGVNVISGRGPELVNRRRNHVSILDS